MMRYLPACIMVFVGVTAGVLVGICGGCAQKPASEPSALGRTPDPALVELVETFRAARDAGDLQRARAMLAEDPRVWYDVKDEGLPWRLGGGRWREWDEHFRSVSTPGPWLQETRHSDEGAQTTLYRVVEEWNEYYDLIERSDRSEYRLTYFFQPPDAGAHAVRIKGYMISSAHPGAPAKARSDRLEEIEAWALASDPDEWAYLRPGGRLDPTGDRARRTRSLINRWRAEVGLGPVR